MYRVHIDPRAKKQLLAVDTTDQHRIERKIDLLAANPRPPGCKRLHSSDGLYRIRIGDYRVVYQIRDRELLILVIRIGHRREVYR